MKITGKILALDLATATGFCIGEPGATLPIIGHVTLPSTGPDIGRFATAFEDWLSEMLRTQMPELVIFEAPILPAKTQLTTLRKLYGLAYDTERQCRRFGITCREGRAAQARKFFIGNGKADKDEIVAAVRRYGWSAQTHDEADAATLWAYAVANCSCDHRDRFALGALAAGVAA